MKCREFMDQLMRSDNRSLRIWRWLAFVNHARTCAACRESAREYRAAVSAMRSLGSVQCPDEVMDQVFHRTGTTPQRDFTTIFTRLKRHPFASGAMAATVIVCVFWVLALQAPSSPAYNRMDVVQADRQVKQTLAYLNRIAAGTQVKISVSRLLGTVQAPVAASLYTGFNRSIRAPFEVISQTFIKGDHK